MDTLISLKRHKYDGVINNPGDIFMAKPKYAKVLCKVKFAKPYVESKVKTPEVKAPEPVAPTPEPVADTAATDDQFAATESVTENKEAESQEQETDQEDQKPAPRRRGRPPRNPSARTYNRRDMVADKD